MANKINEKDKLILIDYLAEYTNDPLGFAQTAFPWGEPGPLEKEALDDWQILILQELTEALQAPITNVKAAEEINGVIREAVASGHGIGKSALVAIVILWALSTMEDTRGVITANTDTQLKSKTWAELSKWYQLFIAKNLFVYTATAIFANDKEHEKTWRIDAIPWSDSNTEAFAGLHNAGKRILLVFDEASSISDKIWEVAEGALTDKNTQIIWFAFGNPTRNTGRFRDCFYKYRMLWKHRQIDSRSCKMGNQALFKEWVDTYGEDSDFVRVRVRGVFPRASENQFIPVDLVETAQHRNLHISQFEFAPVVIGVDPSWTGGDEFVIYMRQGLYSKRLGTYTKNDNDAEMAAILAGFEDEYKASAVFIDQGYGTGIYSFGVAMGRSWILIPFGGKSGNIGYANKRAEMWGEMKKWLQNGGVIERDDVLHDDLIGPLSFVNEKGEIQLEKKEDMKRRGIPSPNRADALALTFALPVTRNTANTNRMCRTEYNPFDF